ncbi:hypothetical protein [Streptococcus orisasini]|uniref:hypothetical protein n=1 Tax=Streptococcus orisasini TaxID=1080071 RepID=UPI00070FD5AF|nr:hypothetical protein [Streptococcus orisasini]
MFGKLLKYEFKSVGAWFFGLYGLAIAISFVMGLWINHNIGLEKHSTFNSNAQEILLLILSSSLVAIFIAILIATLLIIIRRFYNNIFGREGYLTLTLPVSTHKTILAKLLTGFVWTFCSSLVFFISVLLLSLPTINRINATYLAEIAKNLEKFVFSSEFILFILLLIVGVLTSILEIYLAISLGQLFQDYRGLLAFVFYFLINFIRSVIAIVMQGYGNDIFDVLFVNSYGSNYSLTLSIIVTSIYGLIFYFGTHYIIKNKLNIQ